MIEKYELQHKIQDLQLQNILNQLDPHFTFNVLNTLGNYIYKQDKEKAYDLFQRFTRIIRSSLLVSDKVFRTLNEEIKFTEDYLEFQKIRFKERFNYTFDIDKNIDLQNIQFPKMLIQVFAENAVKHAFYGLDYTGQVSIKIIKESNKLMVIIEDDGIGISQSKKLKVTSGTQKGEQILEEQVRQINKLYQTEYTVLIEDKINLGDPQTGTRITITIPIR
jgi:LytS/YehU family sensor histidine kinase